MKCASQDFVVLLKQWRRVRHLSQLALAEVAGVSAKHIAFIESGRAYPSREMVLTLAEALEVPLGERNILLRAAGFADVYLQRPLDAPALEPARRALQFLLARHDPYPAMVIDAAWDLQLANDAARDLLSSFSSGPLPARPNVLRLLFDPCWLRPFIENWADIGSHLLRRLEREAMGAGDGTPIRRVLHELRALHPATEPPTTPQLEHSTLPFIPLVLRHRELRLSMFSLVSSFGTAVDVTLHDLRIETLLPADDSTAEHLRQASTARRRD